jgi:hypothetical protein
MTVPIVILFAGTIGGRLHDNYVNSFIAHTTLIAITLLLATGLLFHCNRKASQYRGDETTLFRYFRLAIAFFAV